MTDAYQAIIDEARQLLESFYADSPDLRKDASQKGVQAVAEMGDSTEGVTLSTTVGSPAWVAGFISGNMTARHGMTTGHLISATCGGAHCDGHTYADVEDAFEYANVVMVGVLDANAMYDSLRDSE